MDGKCYSQRDFRDVLVTDLYESKEERSKNSAEDNACKNRPGQYVLHGGQVMVFAVCWLFSLKVAVAML